MALAKSKFQATLPAADLQRAKKFYMDTLGLTLIDENPGGIAFECGGESGLFLFPSAQAGNNPNTYGGWDVKDIKTEVKALKDKGIEFMEYDTDDYKTVDSIATVAGGKIQAAWFKDSEGNILTLTQTS